MKKIYLAIAFCAALSPVVAQNIADAGRFATTDIAGTARYRAMGGAFGALGGDPTCMVDNPAGIAVYRGTNIVSISPTLNVAHTKTDKSIMETNTKSGMSVSNTSVVISMRPEYGNLVNFNIGLGFNHSEDVNRTYKMTNNNPSSSFGAYVATRANNALCSINKYDDPDYLTMHEAWYNKNVPLIALMGYDCYAIDKAVTEQGISAGGVEAYNVSKGLPVYQRLQVTEKNRTDEYNVNLSANWDDTFYAGVTLTMVDFNSTVISEVYETYPNGKQEDFTEYDNDLETKGTGFNVKFGLLYRPTSSWRLGAAVHTPTWYSMKDFYNGYMLTNDYRVKDYSYASLDGPYEDRYSYQTPWEYQFSTAYVVGQKAILSFEYDLKDFSTAKYTSKNRDADYQGTNTLIKENMQAMHTFKGGLEYRVTDQVSLRAGYAHQSSPYKQKALKDDYGCTVWSESDYYANYWGDDRTTMFDGSTKTNYSLLDDTHFICGGIGYSTNDFFFDFSVTDRLQNENIAAFPTTQDVDFDSDWNCYPLYHASDGSPMGVKADLVNLVTNTMRYEITFGWRF